MNKSQIFCLTIAIIVALSIVAIWHRHYLASQNVRIERGINIGNALEAPADIPWDVTMDIAFFDKIHSAGFDNVRLPVRFSDYVGPAPDYKLDESFMLEIDKYINHALGLGLVIILDLHHFEELMPNPEEYDDKFYAIWTQLSERYKDYPENLIFELLNEPRDAVTPEVWSVLFENALDCIRRTNPTRKVIIDAPFWGSADGLLELDMPKDSHIIASFHYYEPMQFTFQGDEYHPDFSKYDHIMWAGSDEEVQVISDTFSKVANWAEKQNVEVFLGEFGANEKAPTQSRILWTQTVIEEAEKYGFSWCYWELGSQFGIYDIETDHWDKAMLEIMID